MNFDNTPLKFCQCVNPEFYCPVCYASLCEKCSVENHKSHSDKLIPFDKFNKETQKEIDTFVEQTMKPAIVLEGSTLKKLIAHNIFIEHEIDYVHTGDTVDDDQVEMYIKLGNLIYERMALSQKIQHIEKNIMTFARLMKITPTLKGCELITQLSALKTLYNDLYTRKNENPISHNPGPSPPCIRINGSWQ